MIASNLILLQFLLGAALTDLYDRRIPNLLIGTYLSLGMFLNFRCISVTEIQGAPNLLCPLSFLIHFLIIGMMLSVITAMTHAGAGDAKLLALTLSWTGFYEGIILIFPGLLLALAFLLISKAETEIPAHRFRHCNILTPKRAFSPVPFLNTHVPLILLRIAPHKSGKNKIFCFKNKLLRNFGAYIRIPKRSSLPLAVPVFLGAIPRLVTYCFQ